MIMPTCQALSEAYSCIKMLIVEGESLAGRMLFQAARGNASGICGAVTLPHSRGHLGGRCHILHGLLALLALCCWVCNCPLCSVPRVPPGALRAEAQHAQRHRGEEPGHGARGHHPLPGHGQCLPSQQGWGVLTRPGGCQRGKEPAHPERSAACKTGCSLVSREMGCC